MPSYPSFIPWLDTTQKLLTKKAFFCNNIFVLLVLYNLTFHTLLTNNKMLMWSTKITYSVGSFSFEIEIELTLWIKLNK